MDMQASDNMHGVFMLQDLCGQLLHARHDSHMLVDVLRQLQHLCGQLPQPDFLDSIDFVLFPVLVLVDAALVTRMPSSHHPVTHMPSSDHTPSASASSGGGAPSPFVSPSAVSPTGQQSSIKQQVQGQQVQGQQHAQASFAPAVRTDRATEALLSTLCTLVQRCASIVGGGVGGAVRAGGVGSGGVHTGPPALPLLQRVAPLVQLPCTATTEEMRISSLQCITAVIHMVAAQPQQVTQLCAPQAAPLLGGLISGVLSISEQEASAGTQGNKRVRRLALATLEHLVHCCTSSSSSSSSSMSITKGDTTTPLTSTTKGDTATTTTTTITTANGDTATQSTHAATAREDEKPRLNRKTEGGDALAFFVPGLVTGLGKELVRAGQSYGPQSTSGATTDSQATIHALNTLSATLTAVLGDDSGAPLGAPGPPSPTLDAAATLDALRALALQTPSATHNGDGDGGARNGAHADGTMAVNNLKNSMVNKGSTVNKKSMHGSRDFAAPGELRVVRSTAWRTATAAQVCGMLPTMFLPLSWYPRSSVRLALTTVAATLLQQCGGVLGDAVPLLTQLLMSAAQDTVHSVRSAGLHALQQGLASCDGGAPPPTPLLSIITQQALDAIHTLPDTLHTSETTLTTTLQHLTTALQVLPPAHCTAVLLQHPSTTPALLRVLVEVCEFSSGTVSALLVQATTSSLQDSSKGLGGGGGGLGKRVGGGGGGYEGQVGDAASAAPSATDKPTAPNVTDKPMKADEKKTTGAVLENTGDAVLENKGDTTGAVLENTGDAVLENTGDTVLENTGDAVLENGDTAGVSALLVEHDGVPFGDDGTPFGDDGVPFGDGADGYRLDDVNVEDVVVGIPLVDPTLHPPTLHPPTIQPPPSTSGVSPPPTTTSPPPPLDNAHTSPAPLPPPPPTLPRLPLGLLYIHTPSTYAVFSALLHAVGRVCVMADMGGERGVVDGVVGGLMERMHGVLREHQQDTWQLTCASIITVMTHILLGAAQFLHSTIPPDTIPLDETPAVPPASSSSAAAPPTSQPTASSAGTHPQHPPHVSSLHKSLHAWAARVADVCTTPTALAPLGATYTHTTTHRATPMHAADAVLLRVVVEGLGVVCRCVGVGLRHDGNMLRSTLLPLLQHTANPSLFISSAAHDALSVLCSAAQYNALSDAVTSNADIITDELCRQLRALGVHPGAPAAMAAVMQVTGAPRALLPLMADPVHHALQALTITARAARPMFLKNFLHLLSSVLVGALEDAVDVAGQWETLSEQVVSMYNRLNEGDQGEEEAEGQGGDGGHGGHGDGGHDDGGNESGSDCDIVGLLDGEGQEGVSIQEVRAFFDKHNKHKAKQSHARSTTTPAANAPQPNRVVWQEAQHHHADMLRQRVHACALLASSSARAAAPLLVCKNAKVVLLALHVLRKALDVLSHTTPVVDGWQHVVEECVAPRTAGHVAPVPPNTPKLLPVVHVTWLYLIPAIQAPSLAVAEGALLLLPPLIHVAGGQFVSRRMQQEGWPVMHRLLKGGAAQRLEIGDPTPRALDAPTATTTTAPAALARIRRAVLHCITALALEPASCSALRGSTRAMVQAGVGLMGDGDVGADAVEMLRALCNVDPDIVWLELTVAMHDMGAPACDMAWQAPPQDTNHVHFADWNELVGTGMSGTATSTMHRDTQKCVENNKEKEQNNKEEENNMPMWSKDAYAILKSAASSTVPWHAALLRVS